MSIAGLSRILPPRGDQSRTHTILGKIRLPAVVCAFVLPNVWFQPKLKKMHKFHGLDPQSLISVPSHWCPQIDARLPVDIRTALASVLRFLHPITRRVNGPLDGPDHEACAASLER
jgi:hypothetical protein